MSVAGARLSVSGPSATHASGSMISVAPVSIPAAASCGGWPGSSLRAQTPAMA